MNKKIIFYALILLSGIIGYSLKPVANTGGKLGTKTIPYHGVLEVNGEAETGTHKMEFKLSSKAKSKLSWSESHSKVNVQNGRFSVALGSITALDEDDLNAADIELEILVNGVSIGKQPFNAVPYAIRAEQADNFKVKGDLDLEKDLNLKGELKIKGISIKGDLNPVGTVVSSFLSFEQFKKEVGDPATFDPKSSKWAVADGLTDITGSRYETITKNTKTFDLRGQFLRGMNSFDGQNSRSDGWQDPDPDTGGNKRKIGSRQKNELKSHSHKQRTDRFGSNNQSGAFKYTGAPGARSYENVSNMLQNTGGHETRPNNIAVNYFIKIN